MTIALKERIKKISLDVKIFLSRVDWCFFSQIALVFAAFIVPLIILYVIDSGSFDYLWKGRAPYFLFLWLFGLETALGWKNLKTEHTPFWTKKTVLAAVILLLPTI